MTLQSKEFEAEREHFCDLLNQLERDVINLQNTKNGPYKWFKLGSNRTEECSKIKGTLREEFQKLLNTLLKSAPTVRK